MRPTHGHRSANQHFNNLFSHIPSGLRRSTHARLSRRPAREPRGGHQELGPTRRPAAAEDGARRRGLHAAGVRRTRLRHRRLRRLADDIDTDFASGCLETDRGGYFGRLDWGLWRGPLAGRRADGSLVATPDQTGVIVLRLTDTPELDLDAMLTIECQTARIW